MPLVRAQRLLNSIEAGTTNTAALETLLADPGRCSDLAVLFDMPQQARRAMLSTVTRETIFNSPLACNLFFISKNAIKAMVDFPPAKNHFSTNTLVMSNILSNTETTSLVLKNEDFLSVIKSSIPAMNAIAANSTARSSIGVGLGTPTLAYNVLKSSHIAVAKMMAGHAGLDPTIYNTTRDLWNGTAAGVFTPLTNSKDAIRFGLYSSLAGFLKSSGGSQLYVSLDSPSSFVNDANLYFLPLSWGAASNSNSVIINGTSPLGTLGLTPTNADTTMTDPSLTTFPKLLAIAEASPVNNMKVGRVRGTLTVTSNSICGIIGLVTQ